jgi:restriction system protein
MAPNANRLLNQAYGDSGDNLSRALGPNEAASYATFRGGNYSSADYETTLKTITVLRKIPGAVMLVADSGIGASPSRTLGLLEHGQLRKLEGGFHSFYSFAESYLKVRAFDDPPNTIKEFEDCTIVFAAELVHPEKPSQLLLRPAWEAIFREILDNPENLFRFTRDPRAFEEFIANTYKLDGYDVELTPRSNDGGVDVIARRRGYGAIKILDQAKAYAKNRVVPAHDVRAAYGVLTSTDDASKVVITTTSRFAPGVEKEFQRFMPTRLALRHGQNLIDWLKHIASNHGLTR